MLKKYHGSGETFGILPQVMMDGFVKISKNKFDRKSYH